jgi:hypothetical protein
VHRSVQRPQSTSSNRQLVGYDTEVAEQVSRCTLYVIVAQKSRGKQLTRKSQSRVRPGQDQTMVQLRIILERRYLAVVSVILKHRLRDNTVHEADYSSHSGKPRLIRTSKTHPTCPPCGRQTTPKSCNPLAKPHARRHSQHNTPKPETRDFGHRNPVHRVQPSPDVEPRVDRDDPVVKDRTP